MIDPGPARGHRRVWDSITVPASPYHQRYLVRLIHQLAYAYSIGSLPSTFQRCIIAPLAHRIAGPKHKGTPSQRAN